MDIQIEAYLKQFISSKKNQLPEPDGLPRELLNTNRELAECQFAIRIAYQEYEVLKKAFPAVNEFVQNALTHLEKLQKDNQRKYAYLAFKALFTELDIYSLPHPIYDKVQVSLNYLEKKLDYFCSYTRKGLPDINSSYKQIIYEAFGIRPEEHPREWMEVNFVAKLVVRYLNDHGFNNYFIDTDKIMNGEEIEHSVFDFCDRTIVLILLAQQETFRDRKDETNWCYKEFDRYHNTHSKKNYIVFRAEGLVRPEDAGNSILDWYDYMATERGILGTTLESDSGKSKFKNFINEAAKKIRKTKHDAFMETVLSIG